MNNYFERRAKNQLAKSVKQKTFLFLLIGAFSLGCLNLLKLMEPINLPADHWKKRASQAC